MKRTAILITGRDDSGGDGGVALLVTVAWLQGWRLESGRGIVAAAGRT